MLTLYDFEAKVDGKTVSLSQWVAKARIALNYKGIPHRTVFLPEFEIEKRSKELGIPANSYETKDDGSPKWTVPALHDPATGTFITDSTRIIAYLDKAFPDTPQLLSPETRVASLALEAAIKKHVDGSLMYPIVIAHLLGALDEDEEKEHRALVEPWIGMTIEEFKADPKHTEEWWGKVRDGLGLVDEMFKQAEALSFEVGLEVGEGPYLGGRNLTYADATLGGILAWIYNGTGGEESKIWKEILELHGGRWARFWKALEPFTTVH